MQGQLLKYNVRGLQLCFGASVQTVGTVSLWPSSPDSARESWKLERQLLSHFFSWGGTDPIWLWFALLGASTAPPSGGSPSLRCWLRPPHKSWFLFPVKGLLLDHRSSPPGGGRKAVVRKLSYAGPINSHAESALQKTGRDSSALEHIPLMIQGVEANQTSHWIQASFLLGEDRSICRPEGLDFGSTQKLASWGKLLISFLLQEELTLCLCCGSASSLVCSSCLQRLSTVAG